jgi:SAM-dependent methyltransferase
VDPEGCARPARRRLRLGSATRFFANRVGHTAGIDIDDRLIDVARGRYPQIDFRVAPLEAIPYPDEEFDVAVCLDVLEHVDDERRSLDELFRVLRPGGTLILTTPHRGLFAFLDPINVLRRVGLIDDPEHRHYSLADIRGLLEGSAWAGGYELLRVRRAGLLLYPLALWVAVVPRAPTLVKRAVTAAIELDYLVPWGRLAYVAALKIRKT